QLIYEPGVSALELQIQEHSPAFGCDHLQRPVQLAASIVAQRAKDVSEHALRMHADEHAFFWIYLTHHESQMSVRVDVVCKHDRLELAVDRRHARGRGAMDQHFIRDPIAYDVGDRNDFYVVLIGKLPELRQPGHRTVVVHDFADDARRCHTRDSGKVDHGFG